LDELIPALLFIPASTLANSKLAIMRFLFATIALWFSLAASAQGLSPIDQLPAWAQTRWNALAVKEHLEPSTRLNPFVWRGDFDGDGQSDLALLVLSTKTKKEGIAVFFRAGNRTQLLGAGKSFGNGGDDFSWIDIWFVEDRGTLQSSYYEPAVRLKVDGLIVSKEGSASALIYFLGGKPKWQQQGD
jgi:hypothetical protein